ncbi:MAG: FAD-dependent oxidoreductase [Armatimonadetes bacterium]|nr:FAD-dependent oxidoreductase [Armatimonadota bacterium]
MRVGIVGAGVAGLAAARTLRSHGIPTVVFEKSRGLGGRAATRRMGDYVVDHGATIVSPHGGELGRVMQEELDTTDLIAIDRPIYVHSQGRVTPVDPEHGKIERYCYRHGMNTLGKLLADGLDVRLETRIERLETPPDGGFGLAGEFFDAVILTPPLPQIEVMLAGTKHARTFEGAHYRQCISFLLGFAHPFEAKYHALLDPDQSEPLTWLSIETLKVPGCFRAPEGHTAVVAQMGARYSRYSMEKSDEELLAETKPDIARIMGKDFAEPAVAQVMRWKFSHVSNTLGYEAVNRPGSRLLIAGDGLIGARLHQAYDTGVRAANQLVEERAK